MADRTHLVLVSGLLCGDGIWQSPLEILSGISDVRITQQHLRHKKCEEIADAILAECPPNFAIAGSSLGGYIALLVKIRGGSRINKLCLMGSTASLDTNETKEILQRLFVFAEREDLDAIEKYLIEMFFNSDNQNSREIKGQFNAMAKAIGINQFSRQLTAFMRGGDLREELANIDCPTLIINGSEDCFFSPKVSKEIADKIPRSKLVTIDGAANLLPMERPSTITEIMYQWIEGTLPINGETAGI